MFVHDYSDILVSSYKAVTDIVPKPVEYSVIVIGIFHWFYLRTYVYPFFMIYRLYDECYSTVIYGMNYRVMNMMFAFLLGLFALHVFWSYLIIRGIRRKLKNQKVTNSL